MPKIVKRSIGGELQQMLLASRPRPARQFTAVGCYIFAGGFTVGIKQAGFDVLCHLEGDGGYGVSTVNLNYPDLPVFYGPDEWPVEEMSQLPTIDLIYGNPPCAAWSVNNYRSSIAGAWRDDPRINCTYQHFNLLRELRPRVWVWESVTRAAMNGRELIDELAGEALDNGYSVTELHHDARLMGAPQIRKRWFKIAHRVELDFPPGELLPEIAAIDVLRRVKPRGPEAFDAQSCLKLRPFFDQLKPREKLKKLWERINAHVKEPERHATTGRIKMKPGFGPGRVTDVGPCGATVGYAMVHPTQNRFLTINEVQALAGFPQNYEFAGGVASGSQQLRQISRGVLPPVGKWLGDRIRCGLIRDKTVTKPTHRVVDLRGQSVDLSTGDDDAEES